MRSAQEAKEEDGSTASLYQDAGLVGGERQLGNFYDEKEGGGTPSGIKVQ